MDTGGHRDAKGQEGEVRFHGCKDVMVSISLTTVGLVWMQPEAFFVGRKTRRRLASNVKAFAGERRKVKTQPKLQSCRLRVAPEIGLTVCCGQDFAPKRNPQLLLVYVFCFVSVRVLVYLYIVYILLYMYIYLYVIYNIIKNKKKRTHP